MAEIKNIKNLLGQVQTISKSYERLNEANGGNFNLFSILKMESDEVRTHSRFIAELLNPKGVHGFKDEFLKVFLEIISKVVEKKENQDYLSNIKTESCSAEVEAYVGKITESQEKGGSIDILIKDDLGNAIMIENKIYAGEQYNQLLRYKKAYPNGQLIFLTLWGNESENHNSFSDYEPISYQNDIINWLEECKKIAVDNPTLRETIKQYCNLIKKLTHQNISNEMNEELAKLFTKNEENFNSFSSIIHLTKSIKDYTIENKVIPILKELKKEYEEADIEATFNFNENLIKSTDKYAELLSFQNKALTKHNLEIYFDFQQKEHNHLIGGFVHSDYKNNKHIHNSNIDIAFKESFKDIITRNSDHWPYHFHYHFFMNWTNNLSDLKRLIFNNFKADLKFKINSMLDIVKQIDND